MQYSFKATVIVNYETTSIKGKSRVLSSSLNIQPSTELDERYYKEKSGLLTKEGLKALSSTLTAAMVSCIHAAHQLGYRDSAEHLRHVISDLERGFIQVGFLETADDNQIG